MRRLSASWSWGLLVLTTCSMVIGCGGSEGLPEAQTARASAGWSALAHGSLAEVSVEHVLYEQPGEPNFFVRVRIQNLTRRALGVDLRKYFGVFRVNQWGASSSPHRGVIDETRFMDLSDAGSGGLGAAGEAEVLADHRAGVLTAVPPGGLVDYYEEFNAGGRASVDAQSVGHPYLLLVMDGRLLATDGRTAESIGPPSKDADREIALRTPVRWARIPAGALVVRDH